MTTKRSELLRECKVLDLKNYQSLKKCDLQDLIDMVREGKELPEKFTGERSKRPRKLMLYDDPGNPENGYKIYGSISKASRAIGVKPMQVYKMIADGRGTFFTLTNREKHIIKRECLCQKDCRMGLP